LTLKVNLKTVDHSAPYLSPSRTLEITTRKGIITTPTRASTSYEYRQKGRVPTAIAFQNEISIDVFKLNYKTLFDLVNTNENLHKIRRKVELSNRLAQYSQVRVELLQPTTSPTIDQASKTIKYPSGMSLLQENDKALENFIYILINLQTILDYDFITIPSLDLPMSQLEKVYSGAAISAEKIGRQPLIVVDMKNPKFEIMVDYLINNLNLNFVGLIYRDFIRTPQSYRALLKHADKDVAFISIQVDRVNPQNNVSTMHCLPFIGSDLYSVVIPGPFIKDETKPTIARHPRLENIKIFEQESLELNQINLYPNLAQKVQEYPGDFFIRDMLENYTEAEKDDKKYRTLNAFSRVDELRSSLSEFSNLQHYIQQDSSKDYIEDKKALQEALDPLIKPNFRKFLS
jgi:hypothetical protein